MTIVHIELEDVRGAAVSIYHDARGVSIYAREQGQYDTAFLLNIDAARLADMLASVMAQRDDFTSVERMEFEGWVTRFARSPQGDQ